MVSVCYRPPGDDSALDSIAAAISDLQPVSSMLIITGDFNLANIKWSTSSKVKSPEATKGQISPFPTFFFTSAHNSGTRTDK